MFTFGRYRAFEAINQRCTFFSRKGVYFTAIADCHDFYSSIDNSSKDVLFKYSTLSHAIKILEKLKLHARALADDKLNMAHFIRFAFKRCGSIVGKRENCVYKHFRKRFSKTFLLMVLENTGSMDKGINQI